MGPHCTYGYYWAFKTGSQIMRLKNWPWKILVGTGIAVVAVILGYYFYSTPSVATQVELPDFEVTIEDELWQKIKLLLLNFVKLKKKIM